MSVQLNRFEKSDSIFNEFTEAEDVYYTTVFQPVNVDANNFLGDFEPLGNTVNLIHFNFR